MSELEVMQSEVCLLLQSYSINSHARMVLSPWIAHKSLESNHLYEDLGFKSRSEMGKFMNKNFPKLAQQKPKTKLWKKFLYEKIDKIAPACMDCSDQMNCFQCLVSELSA